MGPSLIPRSLVRGLWFRAIQGLYRVLVEVGHARDALYLAFTLATALDLATRRTVSAGVPGKDYFAVKDAINHSQANRDNVDRDYFDVIVDQNTADTFH